MHEIGKAFGVIIQAVGMGLEYILWGGAGLTRRVLSPGYIGAVIFLAILAIAAPVAILVTGLVGIHIDTKPFLAAISGLLFIAGLVGSARKRGVTFSLGISIVMLIGVGLAWPFKIGIIDADPSKGLVVFSGFLFLALACIWWVAAVPAVVLAGAGVELKGFLKTDKKPAPAPVAPAKKK